MLHRNFFTILVATVGLKLCYLVTPAVAVIYFLVMPKRRRGILQYAAALNPQLGWWGKIRFSLRVCKNHIRSLFDSASIPSGVISVGCFGEEVIDRAVERKQGVIILSTHLGPWRSVFRKLKFLKNVYILGDRSRGHLWKDKFMSNEKIRDKVIDLANDSDGFSLLAAFFALKQGELVGMAGDRMNENRRRPVKLLNHNAYLPLAPFLLANKTGALIVPVFAYKVSSKKIMLFFGNAISPSGDAREMQLQYVRILEENILKYPDRFFPPSGDWLEPLS